MMKYLNNVVCVGGGEEGRERGKPVSGHKSIEKYLVVSAEVLCLLQNLISYVRY